MYRVRKVVFPEEFTTPTPQSLMSFGLLRHSLGRLHGCLVHSPLRMSGVTMIRFSPKSARAHHVIWIVWSEAYPAHQENMERAKNSTLRNKAICQYSFAQKPRFHAPNAVHYFFLHPSRRLRRAFVDPSSPLPRACVPQSIDNRKSQIDNPLSLRVRDRLGGLGISRSDVPIPFPPSVLR